MYLILAPKIKMDICEGELTHVKEENEVMSDGILEKDIKIGIVKEEPEDEYFFINCDMCRENYGTERQCGHHKNDGLGQIEQVKTEDDILYEDVKIETVKLEPTDELSLGLDMLVKDENGFENVNSGSSKKSQKGHKKKLQMDTNSLDDKEEKPFQCIQCSKLFSSSSELVTHERTHYQKKPFRCQECPKSFHCKSRLASHIRTHTGERPFQCNFCAKSFFCKSHLIDHLKIHTRDERLQCKFCSRYFPRRFRLVIHQRSHTGEKPFQCKLCSKGFTSRVSLVTHEGSHSRDSNTPEVSSKSVPRGSDPERRSRNLNTPKVSLKSVPNNSDSGSCSRILNTLKVSSKSVPHDSARPSTKRPREKPFRCKLCPKSFVSISHLSVHELKHSKEKLLHQCEVCLKRFAFPSGLSKHLKVHETGETC